MKKIILIFLALTIIGYAGSEVIEPDAEGTDTQWTNSGGADKTTSVTDDVDDNRILEVTIGQKQGFTLGNLTTVPDGSTIDSIIVAHREKATDATGDTVRCFIMLSGNYSYGTSRLISAIYKNNVDKFTTDPLGGAISIADVNAFECGVHCVDVDALQYVYVTKIYVTVYFTPPPPSQIIYNQDDNEDLGG